MSRNGNVPPGQPSAPATDHDLLIRIDERVGELHRCLKGHLARHWAVTTLVIAATLMAAGSLVVALFSRG